MAELLDHDPKERPRNVSRAGIPSVRISADAG